MKALNVTFHIATIIVLNLIIFSSSSSILQVDNGPQWIEYIDITHKITPNLPAFDSETGTGKFIWLVKSIKKGDPSNNSEFKLSTHTGTHIDAPSHFFQKYYDQGRDVTSLDLATLHGRVLVVEVPVDKNITADVLSKLWIPWTAHRVLFKTANTYRGLMHKKEFDSSYAGFTADGAKWMVENTNVKLVGVDYLSTAIYTDASPVHRTFLKNGRTILVEGLNLDGVAPGFYDLQCLPLRMVQADGCPARCILMRTRYWSK